MCGLGRFTVKNESPPSSYRHHWSNDDCLEGKREKLSGLFYAVLCAAIVLSAMHTHMNRVCWLDLELLCGYIVCYSLCVLDLALCDYFIL